MSGWLTPFAQPKYPNAPPLPIFRSIDPSTAATSFVAQGGSTSPPPVAQGSMASNHVRRSSSPSSSLKRKRTPLEVFQAGADLSELSAGTTRENSVTPYDEEPPPSSGLTLASHTPSVPSASPFPPAGFAIDKPIDISSSSPKVASFVILSSQSDERLDDDTDMEDTIVMAVKKPITTTDTKVRTAGAYKTEIQTYDGTKDSDMSDDSDGSLPDLDTILGRKKVESRLPTPPKSTSGRAKRSGAFHGSYDVVETMTNIVNGVKRADDTPSKVAVDKTLQSSLANLVKMHKKSGTAAIAMDEARAAFDEPDEPDDAEDMMDPAYLAALMEDGVEGDNYEKLVHAMQRAEVLNSKPEWHFFGGDSNDDSGSVPDMPVLEGMDDIWTEQWRSQFGSQADTVNNFITGLASEMLLAGSLKPNSVLDMVRWLWSAALDREQPYKRKGYLATARSCMQCQGHNMAVNSEDVRSAFELLGARLESLQSTEPMLTVKRGPTAKQVLRPVRLVQTLQAIAAFAPAFTPDALVQTCCILARLAADSDVTKNDVEVQSELREAFEALLAQLSKPQLDLRSYSKILSSLTSTCHEPVVQDRMLSMLPCGTSMSAAFRRTLSGGFFLPSEQATPLPAPQDSILAGQAYAIGHYLDTSPTFDMHEHTNYTELTARIEILDVVIGPGFSLDPDLISKPPPVQAVRFAEAQQSDKEEAIRITTAQKAHNATIDSLSDKLTNILAKINDRGASHMARTEAKGTLERVIQRLDLSARSTPRRRRGRGAWLMEPPTQAQVKQDPRRTLDAFVKPIKQEAGKVDDAAGTAEKKHVLPATAALSSFGEDEFEARAGI